MSETTEADKRHWEIEKAKAEIAALRRPFYKQLASWISLVVTAVAVSSALLQCSQSRLQNMRAENELALATINKKQTELDLRELDSARAQLEKKVIELKKDSALLLAQKEARGIEIGVLNQKIQSLKVAAENSNAKIQEAVNSVSDSAKTVQQLNKSSVAPVISELLDPSDVFLKAFQLFQEAEKMVTSGKRDEAVDLYKQAISLLEELKQKDKDWQPLVLEYRLGKIKEALSRLKPSEYD